MEEDKFYIIVEDRFYHHTLHDGYTADYHLEKLFDKEQVINCIENKLRESNIIVTNDEDLLSKYLKVINEDEFRMLCEYCSPDFKIEDYNFRLDNLEYFELDDNKVKVSINSRSEYFGFFNTEAYEYFLMIKNGELVSASMDFTNHASWDDERSVNIEWEDYNGWIKNKKFTYLKTPIRYLNKEKTNTLFNFKDVKKANLKELKKLVNFNIAEVLNNKFNSNKNWHWEKEVLKYYDKTSCKRLYISKNHFETIAKNSDLVLMIDTRLDHNFYIEYHITGFLGQEYETEHPTDES